MSSRGSSPEAIGTPTGSSSGIAPTKASYASSGGVKGAGSGSGESPVLSGAPTPGGGFTVSRTTTNQRLRHDSTTSPPLGPSTPTPMNGGSPVDAKMLAEFQLLPPATESSSPGSATPPPATAGGATPGGNRSTTSDGGRSGTPTQDGAGVPQRARSNSKGGTSPVPVPLITPKYQKKERQFNEMNLTDSCDGAERVMSATEMLRQRSVEALTIRSGKVKYGETIDYHSYSLFRHGRHQYHCQSVGYSSEGDLVLNKEEISSSSDSEAGKFDRQVVHVTNAVCLDPYKRRALTDDESMRKKKPNASRLKKYPGIKAPKNKKVRNRLANDHLANDLGREIRQKMREQQMATGDPNEDDDVEGYHKAGVAMFPSFQGMKAKKSTNSHTTTSTRMQERNTFLNSLIDKEPDEIDRALKSRGGKVSPSMKPQSMDKHPDSAQFRFTQLSQRLRDELKRAVKTSEQLIEVINDLEVKFGQYILDCETNGVDQTKPVELFLHNSYCRLVCHGVAGFYKLNSTSEEVEGLEEGVKKTLVNHPKVSAKKPLVELPLQSLMSFLTGRAPMEVFSLDGENPSSVVGGGVITPGTKKKTSPMQPNSKKSSPTAAGGAFDAEIKDGEEDPVYPMTKTQKKKLKKLKKGVNVPMQGEGAPTAGGEAVDDEWEDED